MRLGPRLVLLGHRNVVKGNVVVDDHLLVVEMVRNHADDVDRQGTDLPAIEQVVEAVTEARHHQQYLHALAAVVDFGLHLESVGNRLQTFFQRIETFALLGDEADAHEEPAGVEIVELRAVDDVAALFGEIAGQRSDDAAGRLAADGQHEIRHDRSSFRVWGHSGTHARSGKTPTRLAARSNDQEKEQRLRCRVWSDVPRR